MGSDVVHVNVGVCRKCRHWVEFVSLMERDGVAMLACGCTRFNFVHDVMIDGGEKYGMLRDAMARHGRRQCATHAGKAFWKIVGESLGEEHGDMVRKMSKAGVPGGCPYYMEHAISKWNGSVQ